MFSYLHHFFHTALQTAAIHFIPHARAALLLLLPLLCGGKLYVRKRRPHWARAWAAAAVGICHAAAAGARTLADRLGLWGCLQACPGCDSGCRRPQLRGLRQK